MRIYDEVWHVGAADVAISLYHMSIKDGIEPEKAMRDAIDEVTARPVFEEDLE